MTVSTIRRILFFRENGLWGVELLSFMKEAYKKTGETKSLPGFFLLMHSDFSDFDP